MPEEFVFTLNTRIRKKKKKIKKPANLHCLRLRTKAPVHVRLRSYTTGSDSRFGREIPICRSRLAVITDTIQYIIKYVLKKKKKTEKKHQARFIHSSSVSFIFIIRTQN